MTSGDNGNGKVLRFRRRKSPRVGWGDSPDRVASVVTFLRVRLADDGASCVAIISAAAQLELSSRAQFARLLLELPRPKLAPVCAIGRRSRRLVRVGGVGAELADYLRDELPDHLRRRPGVVLDRTLAWSLVGLAPTDRARDAARALAVELDAEG